MPKCPDLSGSFLNAFFTFPHPFYEFKNLFRVFLAGRCLNPRTHVNAVGFHLFYSGSNVSGIQSARKYDAPVFFGRNRDIPVKNLPGPSYDAMPVRIQKKRGRAVNFEFFNIRLTLYPYGLDNPGFNPLAIFGGFFSVELNAAKPDASDCLVYILRFFVHENANRCHERRQLIYNIAGINLAYKPRAFFPEYKPG